MNPVRDTKVLEKMQWAVAPLVSGERVVVRIAPSPTGNLHVGTARAALFNYLFARHRGGTFLLRIEDTDRARSKKEYEADILESLSWLGLSYDSLFRQSERGAIYARYLEQLLQEGAAYLSKEPSDKNPNEIIELIRLKNPGKPLVFNDCIHGDISFDTTELGDFVIARGKDDPIYHFAAVVDDLEMRVTHVIRGDDHISNTPRQILIQEALGVGPPVYAHLPLILAPDRSKLSKRHGAVSVREYREQGFLPQALVNYLAFLGWNPGGDEEILSLDDLVRQFDLRRVQKSAAIFDIEKLNWINREYIKKMSLEALYSAIEERLPSSVKTLPQYSASRLKAAVQPITEKLTTFGEIPKRAEEGEFTYFFNSPALETAKLLWKDDADLAKVKKYLTDIISMLSAAPPSTFTASGVRAIIWDYATKEGRGSVLWPMRYALSGKEKSPDPFVLSEIFGKEETLARLRSASATIA